MRAIVETRAVIAYQYSELSDEAKVKAREWYFDGWEMPWAGEWRDTLRAFEAQFPVKVKEWECSTWGLSYIRADVCPGEDFDADEMKGVRAWKWLISRGYDRIRTGKGLAPVAGEETGICSLTGFCGDADILEPLSHFLRRPDLSKSLRGVFMDCLESWLRAFEADCEYQESEECLAETMDANGYEFDANGDPV